MVINIFLCLILFFSFGHAELLDEYDSTLKYLNQIKKEIKSESEKLTSITNSKYSLEKKIKSIEHVIKKHKKILSKIDDKYKKVMKERDDLKKKIDQLNRKKNILENKIRDMNIYFLDNERYLKLKLLLFSKLYYDVKNNFELIEIVNNRLYKLVNQYQNLQKELNQLNNKLQNKITDLYKIKRLKSSLINKLENEKLQHKQLLALLNEDEKSIKQYLAILKSKEEELESRFKKLNKKIKTSGDEKLINSSFFKNKGKLPWPVKGKVIDFFGEKKIKGFKGKVYNKGIKIKVDGNGYVFAVFDGIVKYIDWVRGLGNIVIINHDRFFYTLYANLDEVFVKKNQKIKKGEKIGIIDVDLNNKSAYLYFEIRKESKAVDPLNWLEKGGN